MKIFVTGAAGLLGGELIDRLLRDKHSIVGLVRSNSAIRSNSGMKLPARPLCENIPTEAELLTVQGDIADPGIGIDKKTLNLLTEHIDMVIHCAAMTSFDADPVKQEAVNVLGTKNTVSAFPDAKFLHVSTAYTCGMKNGPVGETLHGSETPFMNGYEQSKAAAEHHVAASPNDHVIARPSIVVGQHATGQIKSFDTIYAVFRLIAEGRISAIPSDVHASLDFVPIDHVIEGLIDIVNSWKDAAGRVFHLSSGNPVTPQSLVDAIGSFDTLSTPELVPIAQFDSDRLPARERRLYKMTASHYASYFARNPRFETKNLETLSGRICPIVDGPALKRMIQYCFDAGFLGSRTTA